MDFLSNHLLSALLFFPILAALVVLCLPADRVKLIRWTALLASLVPLGLSIWLWILFQPNVAGFQFEEQYPWYEVIHSTFHLGIDGLSLTMVLLTTLLIPLALLASFSITDKVKAYMMLFLFLETGLLGVFMAVGLLIFFFFLAIGLGPMYFPINPWGEATGAAEIWGRVKGSARNYASVQVHIYTLS